MSEPEEIAIDEQMAEDIRAAERARIATELRKALVDAVPPEPEAYIQGYKDGVNLIAERVLGLVIFAEDGKPPA